MKRYYFIAAFSFLLLAACNNEAKDPVEKADSANAAKADSSDNMPPAITTDEESTRFLVDAANANMSEVTMGELGQQKAAHQQVKEFATQMVTAHTAANTDVRTLAARRNVTLPTAPGEEKQNVAADLGKKSGSDFDKAYMRVMVKEHESVISIFEKASGKVNDAEVKTFIDNSIPKLRMHLDSAKAIQKRL